MDLKQEQDQDQEMNGTPTLHKHESNSSGRTTPHTRFDEWHKVHWACVFDSVWAELAYEVLKKVRLAHSTYLGEEILKYLVAPIENGEFSTIKKILFVTPAICVKHAILKHIKRYGKNSPFRRTCQNKSLFCLTKSFCEDYSLKFDFDPKKGISPLSHLRLKSYKDGLLKASDELGMPSRYILSPTPELSVHERENKSYHTTLSPSPTPRSSMLLSYQKRFLKKGRRKRQVVLNNKYTQDPYIHLHKRIEQVQPVNINNHEIPKILLEQPKKGLFVTSSFQHRIPESQGSSFPGNQMEYFGEILSDPPTLTLESQTSEPLLKN